MPKKSKYSLKDAQHVRVQKTAWDWYVKEFGEEDAAEALRDDLELCTTVPKSDRRPKQNELDDSANEGT
jgi:hypothetical protein